jgi:hypothetical protein
VAPGTPETPRQVPTTGGQQVVDIADTPPPPPVVRRFVKYKNGNEVECIATLPGFEYYSDDIEDAVFEETQGEPPYVDWTVDLKEEMSASKALVKRYGDCSLKVEADKVRKKASNAKRKYEIKILRKPAPR